MEATFVNVTEEILKAQFRYFLSNKNLCNYSKTIIHLKLSEYYWMILSTSSRGLFNNVHLAFSE